MQNAFYQNISSKKCFFPLDFASFSSSQKEVLGKSSRETKTKEIIDELKHSDLPAEVILDRRRKRQIEAELFEKENAAKRKKKSKLGWFFLIS